MKVRFCVLSVLAALILGASAIFAQELGPGFTKVKDGIYTFAPDATTTTCSFVVTQEGVVMIDSCNSPLDSRRMSATIKKVTDKPLFFNRHRNPQRSYRESFCIFAAGDDYQPRRRRGRDEKGVQSQACRNTRGAIPRDA